MNKEKIQKQYFVEKGTVYLSDFLVNLCPCGGISTMERFYNFHGGSELWKEIIYLARCKCGNIFMADMLKESGPIRKLEVKHLLEETKG